MKYVIIAVCAAVIAVSFAAVIKNIYDQLRGKCCGDCSRCGSKCDRR